VFFLLFWCEAQIKTIAWKWLDIDQDHLRIGTAKAVAHLMSFAQITCNI